MREKIFPYIITIAYTSLLIYFLFFYSKAEFKIEKLYDKVNPFIGTDFHGHTFPGATMPFGMVQLSPDTRLDGWDGCSAFHYSDSVIYGFSHTHLSGTGCSDYADILVMPFTNYHNDIKSHRYTSTYKKENTTAFAGYFSTILEDYNIKAELTATQRTGLHKYSFQKNSKKYFCIDLEHRDEVLEAYIKQISKTKFVGMRKSHAWTPQQILFFAMEFSVPVKIIDYDGELNYQDSNYLVSGKKTKIVISPEKENSDTICIKVALSAVSEEGALKNLEFETANLNFDKAVINAQNAWNTELSKILVETKNNEDLIKFYSALYHCYIVPNIYSDVDGSYRSTDLKIHKSIQHKTYTVFSLWDTYRAIHPLFTITQQERSLDFIKTFLDQYKFGGKLPVWELSANETNCMIGYHSVPVIVDAYLKGINRFDVNLAFKAMLKSATTDELGKKEFEKYGYIPMDLEHESVSKTLEYSFDDWCIAKFAKAIGNEKYYKRFIQRAQNYKNIFNPETGFMQPKFNSAFQKNFDPKQVDFNYTEANSWQYSFYVPHDILGLIELHGGEENFAKKLDLMFNESSKFTGTKQADITGLIGQYAHGNEPSHHVAYLFNYCRQPWKTQYYVRKIMKELYSHQPDGLCGNEDCGQMSAWLVFSAMGFYPVNPANGIYDFGSPLFDKITLQLENKRNFTIIAHNNSDKNIYIQEVKLNGKNYNKTFITHKDIIKGGTLEFFMGPNPNYNFGNSEKSIYQSKINTKLICPVPYFYDPFKTFKDSMIVEIKNIYPDALIFYSIDDPNMKEPKIYDKPFTLKDSHTIYSYSTKIGYSKSKIAIAEYKKIPNDRKITLLSQYSPQYSGGGDEALIDFVKSPPTFKSGMWQGYQGQDFEAIIEFTQPKILNLINLSFLQDTRSWIFPPKKVKIYLSDDGKNFKFYTEKESKVTANDETVKIINYNFNLNEIKAKFIRVYAEYYGKLPQWHISSGHESWLFIDEIEIN